MERCRITLEEIERKEARDKDAFSTWLDNDHDLMQLRPRAKYNLKLYVNGLLSKIADLESDIHRPS